MSRHLHPRTGALMTGALLVALVGCTAQSTGITAGSTTRPVAAAASARPSASGDASAQPTATPTPTPTPSTTPSATPGATPTGSAKAGTTGPGATGTAKGAGSPTGTVPAASGVPTIASLGALVASGPVTVHSGQTVSGLRISSSTGSCVIVPAGVTNVTIVGNEIGPCGSSIGNDGVEIWANASAITVRRNVIHDVSTGVSANHSQHPIVMEQNLVYGVRGPYPAGQMVQFNSVTTGAGQSRIVGNVSDKTLATSPTHYEDHISMYRSGGSSGAPILIACNKLRGNDSATGTGIMVGDTGGSWFDVRSNVVVDSGIGVAGGHHVTVSGNVVLNHGASVWYAVFDYAGFVPDDVAVTGNRGAAYYVPSGRSDTVLGEGLFDDGSGTNLRYSGNTWSDATITPAIWNLKLAGCA